MKFKTELGRRGEEKTAHYLKQNGYKILARNFRNRLGEIDIVAQDRGVLCFVEVRTRRGANRRADALASVDRLKQHKLSKLALSYLKEKNLLGCRARFDVVSVSLDEGTADVFLIKDAFPVSERYA